MNAGKLRSQKPAHQGFRPARRGERGSVLLFVAVSLVAIFSFCILAIDAPIMMTTKTQLQNAADAAALAAAGVYDPESDDADALATQMAIDIAASNYAVQDSVRPVIIEDADVTFPVVDGTKRVRVRTFRTQDHGDPLRTYFLRIPFLTNTNLADVEAVAAAQLSEVCGLQCVKPWAIPDDFDDANGNGVWDPGEFYDPLITGYLAPGDIGTDLIIKAHDSPGTSAPGQYYPINYPPLGHPTQDPLTGADIYREYIATCSPWTLAPGDSVQVEPGKMVGPTIQGVLDLIAQDATAFWNPITNDVVSTYPGLSPRIILVPFFDPRFPPVSGRPSVNITKIGAFFLESVGPGSQVNAKFMKVSAPGEPCDEPSGGFVFTVHLVE